MIKNNLIANEEVTTIVVHFRRTLLDILRGVPKVATFKGFDAAVHSPLGLTVRWANSQYFYPATSLSRVKLSK